MRFWCVLLLTSFSAAHGESSNELTREAAARKAQGNPQGALELYQKAAKLSPNSASIQNEIGFLLAVLQKPAEAKDHFQKAIELQPDFAPALYHLGVLYWLEKNPNTSIPLLQNAARLAPKQFDYRYRLGIALRDVGHY